MKMENTSLRSLKQQMKNQLDDLTNTQFAIADIIFKKHYDKLYEDVTQLEKDMVCNRMKKIDGCQFRFSFVGKYNNVIIFEYDDCDDQWICNIDEDGNPTIISHCESINKFCNDLVTNLL